MEATIKKWLKQAEHDFQMAKEIIKDGGYDTCAFLCQQAVEKYLKALFIYKKSKNPPKTHYLDELAKLLSCPAEIINIAKDLAADYMISRYPDAANLAPCDEYSKTDAEDRINKAQKIITWVKQQLQ
ncbi:MAG: HEPN domain-containing protein [bacterium]